MNSPSVAVLKPADAGPDLPIIEGRGRVAARVWPGMGAQHRSLHVIDLEPGARTRDLAHPSEAVYYVVSGHARVADGGGGVQELDEGAMVHIRPGQRYRLEAADAATTMIGGPCPPDPRLYEEPGYALDEEAPSPDGVRVFHRDNPGLKVPLISRDARFVVWLGVGAETANMNFVVLEPGEANVPHRHDESEDTIFILAGRGSVEDLTNGTRLEFETDDVVHVPVGVDHAVHADAGVMVVSAGGPCPADRHLLAMLGYGDERSGSG